MSGANMVAWKRQNSTSILVEVRLLDGAELKGTVLIQREQTLKDAFSGPDPFVDFECAVSGEMVLGKTAIAMVRPCKQAQPDHLERRLKMLEKSDAFTALKVAKTADRAKVCDAHLALARIYHADRYATSELPAEVLEYFQAMARRIDSAKAELDLLMEPRETSAAIPAVA